MWFKTICPGFTWFLTGDDCDCGFMCSISNHLHTSKSIAISRKSFNVCLGNLLHTYYCGDLRGTWGNANKARLYAHRDTRLDVLSWLPVTEWGGVFWVSSGYCICRRTLLINLFLLSIKGILLTSRCRGLKSWLCDFRTVEVVPRWGTPGTASFVKT